MKYLQAPGEEVLQPRDLPNVWVKQPIFLEQLLNSDDWREKISLPSPHLFDYKSYNSAPPIKWSVD